MHACSNKYTLRHLRPLWAGANTDTHQINLMTATAQNKIISNHSVTALLHVILLYMVIQLQVYDDTVIGLPRCIVIQ